MGQVGPVRAFRLPNFALRQPAGAPAQLLHQNKAGDLISRINNDTDKLNQFFAQGLVQLAANLFLMIGAAIFLLMLSPRLGAAALVPAAGVLIVTQLTSGWVKRQNVKSLQSLGGLSAEVQESLENFK